MKPHPTRFAPATALAAAILIAGALPAMAQDEEISETAAFEAVSCDTFEISETAAAIADCGYVTVPENRAAGTAGTIQLGVVRMRSSSDDPAAPMFVGTGGPGGPGLGFISRPTVDAPSLFAPILDDRDIVWFTQRGTPGAIPTLACPEYDAVNYGAAANGWTAKQKERRFRSTLQACFDEYAEQGVDIAGYNSVENASDIVDIKDALGYDTINYYGESYGTLLGQFLMRDHEEILDSVILDGVVPATPKRYSAINDIPGAFARLFAACEADAACSAAYPDLASELRTAANRLNRNPVPFAAEAADGTTVDLSVDGDRVLDFIFTQLSGGGAAAPLYTDAIFDDPTPLLGDLAPHDGPGGVARAMHFAVNCADDPNTSLKQFRLSSIPGWLRGYVRDDAVRTVIACELLDLPRLPASSDALLETDLPTLLVNGGLDPATGPANGRDVEAGLPNSQYMLFPAGGHIQKGNPCAVAIMDAFLTDPMAPVDTSCIQPAPAFQVPLTAVVTSDDGAASLSATLAPGWIEDEPGAFVNPLGILLRLQALPTDVAPDDAIVAAFSDIAPVDAAAISDGAPVAGNPTRYLSADVEAGDTPVGLEAWAFSTPDATYVVAFALQPAAIGVRESLGQIIDTVSVEGS